MTRESAWWLSYTTGCPDGDSDHHLSGPFHVPGAQPGDVLEIDVLE